MPDASLLPDDYLAEARERRTNILGLTLFAVVLGGVAAWFTRTNLEWREIRDRQEQVGASFSAVAEQIRDMQEQEKTRREMVEKAQLALSLVDPIPRSILLGELVQRMPEKVSLIDLDLRSEPIKMPRPRPAAEAAEEPRSKAAASRRKAKTDGEPAAPPKPEPVRYAVTVLLTGIAPTDLDLSRYLQALGEFDLLESVRLEVSEEKQVLGVPSRQFRIAIRIAPQADIRLSRSLMGGAEQASAAEVPPTDPGAASSMLGTAEEFVGSGGRFDPAVMAGGSAAAEER